MIPFGAQTVTLYRRVRKQDGDGRMQDTWQSELLNGCSWRQRSVQTLADGAVLRRSQTVCRIPAGQTKPEVGDVLILGDARAMACTAKQVAQLLDQHRITGAIRVSEVADNTHGGAPMAHYAAKGDSS